MFFLKCFHLALYVQFILSLIKLIIALQTMECILLVQIDSPPLGILVHAFQSALELAKR